MDEHSDFEWAAETTRRDAAALLRDLADGVDAGEVAVATDGTDSAGSAAVPERLHAELELERIDDEVELEVELSWPEPDRDDHPRDGVAAATDDAADSTGDDADPSDADAEAPEILTDDDGPSASRGTFEVYRDRADEWRWRLVHDNGNIVADSGEGYARRATALNGLRSVQHNAPGASVEVEED
jgi:amphi-Trp domain-containing protein